jgi:hypothetical protein
LCEVSAGVNGSMGGRASRVWVLSKIGPPNPNIFY